MADHHKLYWAHRDIILGMKAKKMRVDTWIPRSKYADLNAEAGKTCGHCKMRRKPGAAAVVWGWIYACGNMWKLEFLCKKCCGE